MKVRDVIKTLVSDGWYLVQIKGSHRQYKHPLKAGKVTVPGKPGDDVPEGLLTSIRKHADLA